MWGCEKPRGAQMSAEERGSHRRNPISRRRRESAKIGESSEGFSRSLAATLAYPRVTLYRESRSNFLGFRVSYSDTKKLIVIHFQLQIRGSGLLKAAFTLE